MLHAAEASLPLPEYLFLQEKIAPNVLQIISLGGCFWTMSIAINQQHVKISIFQYAREKTIFCYHNLDITLLNLSG